MAQTKLLRRFIADIDNMFQHYLTDGGFRRAGKERRRPFIIVNIVSMFTALHSINQYYLQARHFMSLKVTEIFILTSKLIEHE